MLLVVCLVSGLAVVLVVLRWAIAGVDALGRRREFPIFATGLPLVLALVTGVPAVRHTWLEHRLDGVAGQLVGSPVSVRCETLGQAWTDAHSELGYVRFGADGRPEPAATITWQACSDLRSWSGSDHEHPSLQQIVAVHVLTHEAMHMAGLRDEARTECAAVQRDVRTARLLGADVDQARALAATYWSRVYPRLSDDYRTMECGPDAPLDEHMAEAPWNLSRVS
jgi:hypothetical protein